MQPFFASEVNLESPQWCLAVFSSVKAGTAKKATAQSFN